MKKLEKHRQQKTECCILMDEQGNDVNMPKTMILKNTYKALLVYKNTSKPTISSKIGEKKYAI